MKIVHPLQNILSNVRDNICFHKTFTGDHKESLDLITDMQHEFFN
jgi:hypothetical protein